MSKVGESDTIEKMLTTLFALFGQVKPPEALKKFGDVNSGGIGVFLNLIINILVVVGGIYALFNLVLAGYGFMGAGDDPKKVQAAWAKIWQTLMGLAFVAGSYVMAAIFGKLVFGDASFLLSPTINPL